MFYTRKCAGLIFALLPVAGMACNAQDATPAPNDAGAASGLEFRVRSVPETVFFNSELSGRNGAHTPKPGVVSFKTFEGDRYDVTEFLTQYGLAFPPGSLAFYSGMLVVRDTPENLRLLDQLFAGQPEQAEQSSDVAIECSAYECTLPPSDDLMPWKELTFSGLQKLPRSSLKLLDSISVGSKSGQRSVASRIANPSQSANVNNDAAAFEFHRGETGALLEVEPVNNESGIDLNIAHRMRVRLGDGTGADIAETNFVASTILWQNYPAVVHVAPVQNQQGKYIVVVAEGRTPAPVEWKWQLPKPKFPLRHLVAANGFVKGGKGAPQMMVNVYRVPPGFFDGTASGRKTDPIDFLKGAGIEFPPGSAVDFDKATNTLIVLSTEEYLDLVDRMVDDFNPGVPTIIMADLLAYECKFPGTQTPPQADKFTFSDLGHMNKNFVKLLGCVSTVAGSGQRVMSSDITNPALAAGAGPMAESGPLQLQSGETGMKVRIDPTAGSDGKTVDTEAEYTLRFGKGSSDEVNGDNKFKAQNDVPQVIQVTPVKERKGTCIVMVIRMRIVNSGGWNTQGTQTWPPQFHSKSGSAMIAPQKN